MSEKSKEKTETKSTPVYKKWWFWVVVVLVIAAIGGGSESSKNGEKVGQTDGATSSQSSSQDSGAEPSASSSGSGSNSDSAAAEHKVGDVVAFDIWEVAVTKVEHGFRPEYGAPDEGKEYVKITVELKNTGSKTESYGSYDFKLEDSNGDMQSTTFVLGVSDSLSTGELAAGGKKSGSLVYEAPKGDTGLKLHYRPNMFLKNREVVIKID